MKRAALTLALAFSAPVAAQTTTFEISSAHHYDLTGPYAFTTDFYYMASFNAPTGQPTNISGHFVFLERSADHQEGKMQIKFPRVFANMRFKCAVSLSADFDITVNAIGPRMQVYSFTERSAVSGGQNYLTFDLKPMLDPSELNVMIKMTQPTRRWELDACQVTATAR